MSTTRIRGRGLVSSVHGTQVHTHPLSPLSLLSLLLFISPSLMSCARLTDSFPPFFIAGSMHVSRPLAQAWPAEGLHRRDRGAFAPDRGPHWDHDRRKRRARAGATRGSCAGELFNESERPRPGLMRIYDPRVHCMPEYMRIHMLHNPLALALMHAG